MHQGCNIVCGFFFDGQLQIVISWLTKDRGFEFGTKDANSGQKCVCFWGKFHFRGRWWRRRWRRKLDKYCESAAATVTTSGPLLECLIFSKSSQTDIFKQFCQTVDIVTFKRIYPSFMKKKRFSLCILNQKAWYKSPPLETKQGKFLSAQNNSEKTFCVWYFHRCREGWSKCQNPEIVLTSFINVNFHN